QAEDGIRDFHVTGVQTCALPILPLVTHLSIEKLAIGEQRITAVLAVGFGIEIHLEHQLAELRPRDRFRCVETHLHRVQEFVGQRSEERRVGEECRYWWYG